MDKRHMVTLRFETMYYEATNGAKVALVGSLKEMGEWEAKNCVVAEECPHGSGRWIVEIQLPPRTSSEWKWMILSADKRTAIKWEERANRILSTGVLNGKVLAPWNNDTSFSPDVETTNIFITNSSTTYEAGSSINSLNRGSSLLDRVRRNPCALL